MNRVKDGGVDSLPLLTSSNDECSSKTSSEECFESTESTREEIDIDEFLIRSGECGWYQIKLVALVKILTFPISFPVFIFYFIGIDPSWTKLSDGSVHPKDDLSRCSLNRSEWIYNYSKQSMVTEFDLVCEDTWLLGALGSSVFIGWGMGSVVMGYFSDLYGRKTVMFPCILMEMICLLLHYFIKPVWLLIAVRFMMGVFHAGPGMNSFILCVEFIGPNCRVLGVNIAGSVWVIGSGVLALKAHLIDDWRMLCLICSAPYFGNMLMWFCFPESIRWLNAKGRTEEAEKILQQAAKLNGKANMTKVSIKPVVQSSQSTNDEDNISYLDLFKRWDVAKITLAQAFLWFVAGMVYYTFSWAFADIGGDIYLNFFLSVLVEIPTHVVAVVMLQTFGRKKTTLFALIITALSCVCVAFLSANDDYAAYRLAFGLIGKCTISLVFMSIYMWSAEIYPTIIRTQGMGINQITSRLGAAMSPFVKILDHFHPAAPFLVMSVPTFIGIFLSLLLPETLGKPTRETFDELFQ